MARRAEAGAHPPGFTVSGNSLVLQLFKILDNKLTNRTVCNLACKIISGDRAVTGLLFDDGLAD